MQLKLTPADVAIALTTYLQTKGINTVGQLVSFEYTNKRKHGGVHVNVTIGQDAVVQPTPALVAVVESVVEASEPVIQEQVQAQPVTESLFG